MTGPLPAPRNAQLGLLEAVNYAQQAIGVDGQRADAEAAINFGNMLQEIYQQVNATLSYWAKVIQSDDDSNNGQITKDSTAYQMQQTIGQNTESQWQGYQQAQTSATTQDGTNMQTIAQFGNTVNTLMQAVSQLMNGWV